MQPHDEASGLLHATGEAAPATTSGGASAECHRPEPTPFLELKWRFRRWLRERLVPLRRLLLRIALADSYGYFIRTLAVDKRIKTARMVDIVVRKDGVEKRFEADWIKTLARVCWHDIERARAKREIEHAAYLATNPTDGQAPGRGELGR